MSARAVACLLLVTGLVLARPGAAKDPEKAQCKADCRIQLQTCKQDCQIDRDSGTQQESDRYRSCDQSCHDIYAGCTQNCEEEE